MKAVGFESLSRYFNVISCFKSNAPKTGAAGVVMETERQHKTDKQEAPFLAAVFTVFGKFSH